MQKHWNGYVNALGGNKPPASSVDPYPTSDSKIGTSGFLDLKPLQPEIQARYDTMSPSWEGIKASETAIKNGMFRGEFMAFKK